MGNILEFPSRQAQGLAYLDKQLRELLESRGADPQLVDFAAGQLTDSYARLSESEQYSFKVELPETISEEQRQQICQQINEGLAGIREENHTLMLQLMAQLLLAEVRLFQQQRS